MADKLKPGPIATPDCIREAVCIHTSKIFDSCRDKDCIEDLRVYPTCGSQSVIDTAFSIRPRSATLLYADVRVEEINFNRGCYTVDVTYFYKVCGEAFPGERPVKGLAVFEKRIILYGSEGNSKVFTSRSRGNGGVRQSCLPVAVVEVVDPLALSMKIVEESCHNDCDCEHRDIPNDITNCFDDDLVTTRTCKQLYVTLGQFSIIRLERDTQLLMPVYDYCIPDKECACGGGDEDPCALFGHIPFPIRDFFPPDGGTGKCISDPCCDKNDR
ncbi:MAG: hypothetical protein RR731_02095 [Oscillospiraceae bacterium]